MWESEYKTIGQKIKLIRLNRGISQGELAKRIDIVQAALSAMENGKSRASLRRPFPIRDALGCSIHGFFEDDVKDEKITVEEIVEAMRLAKKSNSSKQLNLRRRAKTERKDEK